MSFKSAERDKWSEAVSELLFCCPISCDYLGRPPAVLKFAGHTDMPAIFILFIVNTI